MQFYARCAALCATTDGRNFIRCVSCWLSHLQLSTICDGDFLGGSAGLWPERFHFFYDAHSVFHSAEDDVPAIQPKPSRRRGLVIFFSLHLNILCEKMLFLQSFYFVWSFKLSTLCRKKMINSKKTNDINQTSPPLFQNLPLCFRGADEELGSIGVRSGVGHR